MNASALGPVFLKALKIAAAVNTLMIAMGFFGSPPVSAPGLERASDILGSPAGWVLERIPKPTGHSVAPFILGLLEALSCSLFIYSFIACVVLVIFDSFRRQAIPPA